MERAVLKVTYGSRWLDVGVPGQLIELVPSHARPARSEEEIVRAALERPVAGPALAECARGRRSAIILIACRTRRTGSQVFVPEIVRVLNEAGLPDDAITVYTATGTHDNFRPQDAELLAGADCARRLRFMGHDCRTPETLVEVGTTSRGNRVRVSRAYLDADLKIATGRVTYHYFAGFSAGRKAVLPGVCAQDTILFNHAFAVERTGGTVRLNPEARNGNLATNPVHLDMLDAARMAPPDFTLSTVLDTDDRLVGAFGGDMEAAHAAGVAVVRAADRVRIDAPCDWMVVSCGGAHCDGSAIQAIKALLNSYRAVRRGGAIIFVAECPEGAAGWLTEACSLRGPGELEGRILEGRVRQAHNPLWIRDAREHAHVIMVTSLPQADVEAFGFHRAASLEEAAELATRLAGTPRTTAVVPYGNITVVEAAGAADTRNSPTGE